MKSLGIDIFNDCVNINSINCFPSNDKGKTRAPKDFEIECCRHVKVNPAIEQYKPKVIILFGGTAVQSVIGNRWKDELGGITTWRGWTIPDRDLNAWVCPVFHPSYVMRMDSPEVDKIWKDDLERAISMKDVPFPDYHDESEDVRIISGPEKLPPFPDIVTFDYETTGLKPQKKSQKILCASVAYNEDEVYSFMMPNKKSKRKRFLKMLRTKSVGKIAHNIKFENNWSIVKLKQGVVNWQWDSMIASHVLDNRPKISGLKFQVYVNFGVVDYDSHLKPYMKMEDEKDSNSTNDLVNLCKSESGRESLLKYCGLDSIFEHKLAMKQMKELGKTVRCD